jgi:hypothetical protein
VLHITWYWQKRAASTMWNELSSYARLRQYSHVVRKYRFTMKVITATTIICSIFYLNGYGQQKLTKEEILKTWKGWGNEQYSRNQITNADSILNVFLTKLSDSLEAEKVDSIIIFSTALPGYYSQSSCDTGMIVTSFAIWTKNGSTRIRQMQGVCTSEILNDTLNLFDYFENKRDTLDSEIFMPVILSAEKKRYGTISFQATSIDHEPNYSFYFNINGYKKSFHFCESFLENDKGLFMQHNRSLLAYRWWQNIKNKVEKQN